MYMVVVRSVSNSFDLTKHLDVIFQVVLCQCSCYVAEDQQYQWLEKVRETKTGGLPFIRAPCLNA